MKPQTQSIREQIERSQHREHSSPTFMTSSFVFDSAEHAQALFAEDVEGDIYTRYSNPNTTELIDKMVALEGAEDGLAFASGMAAVFAGLAGLLNSGDHVVASRSLFGSTHVLFTQILPRWGITHSYVDVDHPEAWESSIRPETKLLFAETPSNPGLDLIDLQWLGDLKHKHGLLLMVDNCFATPVVQQPARYGADLIAHSTTKFIDGQGRTIGGLLLGSSQCITPIRTFARHTGPSMSPFNAWILSKSLETLELRMERHCQNALDLAHYFDGHPDLLQVKYPGLLSHPQFSLAQRQMRWGGGLFTMEVKGGLERATRFINATELLSISSNLGDTRTIVTHPTTTTHSKLSESERQRVGIRPGLLRISVGLEDVEDIQRDIEQALERSK